MKLLRKLHSLFQKQKPETRMTAEMQAHLSEAGERNFSKGVSEGAARYTAQRGFGGVKQIKVEARDQWATRWLEHGGRDLRFSFRSLRRSPVFSLAVVATLALCIGANTSIVSVLYGLILKPLPF